MSPSLKMEEYKYSKSGLAEGIRTRYDSRLLPPNVVCELPPVTNSTQEVSRYGALHDGVNQRLRVLIKTPKDEFYAIVDITIIERDGNKISEISEATALTRHVPNQKAEWLGFLEDHRQITVSHDQAKTSVNDFSVMRNDDGRVGIVGYEATDHIEIFTPSNNPYEMSKRLLHMDTVDAAENPDFWSFKTSEQDN